MRDTQLLIIYNFGHSVTLRLEHNGKSEFLQCLKITDSMTQNKYEFSLKELKEIVEYLMREERE